MDWYLGRVGSLVQIPAPADPAEVTPDILGGVAQSLGGATTVDRTATPRSWKFQWPYLVESNLTYLEAIGFGLVKGPLRLVDPMRRNRLPAQISSGGSQRRDTTGWTQTGGSTPTWAAVTDPPGAVPVRGVISWQRTTTAAAALTTSNVHHRVPVVPAQQVRVSCWARGAAIQAAAGVDGWDSSGASTRTTGTAATLNTTTWTQLTATLTPASDRVSLSPLLSVASGQAASTLQTTGWMLSAAAESTTWALGGGAPVVVASELGHSVSLFDTSRHSWQMTFREALI